MSQQKNVVIYGEVLFDCLPSGDCILGGAPFNVAWHLQAFKVKPTMISRVGNDEFGEKIRHKMHRWGLGTQYLQVDQLHPTGRVNVKFDVNNEPVYVIEQGSAWDYIDQESINTLPNKDILYHGTLATRNEVSRNTLNQIIDDNDYDIFIDVNLRKPWWDPQSVIAALTKARWAKLNIEELQLLQPDVIDINESMTLFQQRFNLDHLLVTFGADGAKVKTYDEQIYQYKPQLSPNVIDSVGAGDAFTAMYLYGLLANWDVPKILSVSQKFASQTLLYAGALNDDRSLYETMLADLL